MVRLIERLDMLDAFSVMDAGYIRPDLWVCRRMGETTCAQSGPCLFCIVIPERRPLDVEEFLRVQMGGH